jgi:hypothetical protein
MLKSAACVAAPCNNLQDIAGTCLDKGVEPDALAID